ncbi:hypothetical protein [Nostoc sp.]
MLLIVRKINHELAIAGQIRPFAKVPNTPPLTPPLTKGRGDKA